MPLGLPILSIDEGLTPRLNEGPTVPAFFDFFFSDNLGRPADDFNQFIQWTVSDGSVDFVGGTGPGVFGAPPEEPNGRYVDLGGSTGDPGAFTTRLAYPVIAGQTVNLTFDFRSTAGDYNTATVTVGDRSWTVGTSETTFQRFSENFVVENTGLVQISFQGDENDRDGSGVGIDGVLFGPSISVEALLDGSALRDLAGGLETLLVPGAEIAGPALAGLLGAEPQASVGTEVAAGVTVYDGTSIEAQARYIDDFHMV